MLEQEYFTVYEIADLLKISRQTVTRQFSHRPGVIRLGQKETRYGRPHIVLRIPKSVLESYLAERSL